MTYQHSFDVIQYLCVKGLPMQPALFLFVYISFYVLILLPREVWGLDEFRNVQNHQETRGELLCLSEALKAERINSIQSWYVLNLSLLDKPETAFLNYVNTWPALEQRSFKNVSLESVTPLCKFKQIVFHLKISKV